VTTKPSTFVEVEEKEERIKAMDNEYEVVIKKMLWKIIECSQSVKQICCKWVHIINYTIVVKLINLRL
jgi:hypothetical protein